MEQESTSHLSSSSARDDGIAQSREQEVHPPAPAASFHTLPNELVYHVFSMLRPAAAVALGLTCKPMWALLNSQHNLKELLADRADLLAFRGLIEDQFPNHLLCHVCGCFHLRPAKRPPPSHPNRWQSTSVCDFRAGHIHHPQPQLWIPFVNAQEVMNAHRFGLAHGLPSSTLTRTIRIKRIHRTIFRRTAAIANGDLLLRTDAITIKPTISFFDNWIDKVGLDIGVVNKLYKFMIHFFHPRGLESVFFRCPTCGREARKKFTETETETENYKVEICETSWCNLGPCRTPKDPRWHRAARCPEGCSRAVVIGTEAELRYVEFFDDGSPAMFWEEPGEAVAEQKAQREVRAEGGGSFDVVIGWGGFWRDFQIVVTMIARLWFFG
ncbi:hypothetical protein FQN55_001986 [Onygenales sp. PD_40]|nr:hypothetical protein FQN55_001986 [Onygenales sp. PD_40]KAK2795674.1 hypothetical protein FQN52_003523 [Onygenales sp. PD_12]